MKVHKHLVGFVFVLSLCACAMTRAQFPDQPPPDFFSGGPGGPGGFPGFNREERRIRKQFDTDANGWLNATERKTARDFLAKERANGGNRQRGPRPFNFGNEQPPQPGPRMSVADAKTFPGEPLYASNSVRTLFLDFEETDWAKELSDFHGTDVEVPAKLTVDGKVYPRVGVHFRGASSYNMVSEGHKRSFNVSVDYVNEKQSLLGYRTLNLMNSHDDASFLRAVLFYQVAREYIPAPKANFVRVVVNGEYWGVFVNIEQFNKDFVKEWFNTTSGARWKVTGSPRGQGGLAYVGDDVAAYKKNYEIKSKDDPKSWADLIKLCKTLNQTPPDKLEAALSPMLDIDGALKFLALDNALINNDGYWIRTSDYSIYEDTKGKFHVIPWDANETFARPGGPGFGGRGGGQGRGGPGAPGFAPPTNASGGPTAQRGPGGPFGPGGPGGFGGNMPRINGVELDPLLGASDTNKPLISKLLAVPALRQRYLGYVREIAEKHLDWNRLGPVAQRYHDLIAADVKADTRKLDSTEDFERSLTQDGQGRGGASIALKNFADQRRAYLLRVTEPQKR